MPITTQYKGRHFSVMKNVKGTEFGQTDDEVLIVAITAGNEAILIREPSAAFDTPLLFLPGGAVESDEAHSETANRELQEEAGYRAEQLDYIGELRPFSKYLRVRSFLYLGRQLVPSKLDGDEEYEISVVPISVDNFESLIVSQQIFDARVIAALYLARQFLRT
jgi:ADP-ribose diphosphatase